MDAAEDGHAESSGMIASPLLKRLVKFAIAATSVISTTCSSLKCSNSASRVSLPRRRSASVRGRTGWRRVRARRILVLLRLERPAISSSVMPAFLPAGNVRRGAEGALVGIGAGQVDQFLHAAVHGARAPRWRRRAAQNSSALRGGCAIARKKGLGCLHLASRLGQEFVLAGFH